MLPLVSKNFMVSTSWLKWRLQSGAGYCRIRLHSKSIRGYSEIRRPRLHRWGQWRQWRQRVQRRWRSQLGATSADPSFSKKRRTCRLLALAPRPEIGHTSDYFCHQSLENIHQADRQARGKSRTTGRIPDCEALLISQKHEIWI
jgi:hypothetical protein